eukprot:TRINITY_DN4522_c0_g1_i2.p2 TRINITY_DN4522_c0_g1~~TRINITY_DN4522_c0_g1_i2.p2  ORF type:complete len:152 (+),score=11.47 TRINITY_DN4522_c0_g1_i2:529-984(+)
MIGDDNMAGDIILVFDGISGKLVRRFSAGESIQYNGVAILGDYIVTRYHSGTYRIWSIQKGMVIREFKHTSASAYTSSFEAYYSYEERKNYFTILANGKLYKCEFLVGEPEVCTGATNYGATYIRSERTLYLGKIHSGVVTVKKVKFPPPS